DGSYRELDESIRSLTSMLQRAQDEFHELEERREERRKRAARAARKVQRAMAKCGMPVFELSPELVVLSANPAAERLCGADPLGKPLFTLLEPLHSEAVAVRWHKRLLHLEPVAETLACSASDQRALACDFICMPKVRKGKLAGITVLVRDE